MLLDKQAYFSDAQTITTGSDSGIASTNYYDFGAVRDIGVGENLFLVVQVDTAMTDASSNSALEVRTEADDNTSFSSAASVLLHTFPALTAAGTRKVFRVSPEVFNQRYGQLKFTSTNGALSTCAVSAFLTHDADLYTAYADAVTIQ